MNARRTILTVVSIVLLAGLMLGQGQRGAAPAGQPGAPGAASGQGRGGRGNQPPPDTVFIEEMTWEEVRDAIRGGKTVVIVPTGGVEKNGYHMVLGKHDYVVAFNANKIARRLGNALVAPTIQYVPGNPDSQSFGEFHQPSAAYDRLLEAAARSLKVHGFKDILLIGDSGGNQAGLTTVANKLNEEWKGTDVKVFALPDYYNVGREHYRAYLMAAYGYDDQMVGSHAGISDTSQMMYLRPEGIRFDQIKPFGGARDSGVSGDPSKATAEIGKMGSEFKINAALNQYRALKNPPAPRGGGGRGTPTDGAGGRGGARGPGR